MSSSRDQQDPDGLDAGDQGPALTAQLFPTQGAATPDNNNDTLTSAVSHTAAPASIHPPVAGWTDGFAASSDALASFIPYGDQYPGLWNGAASSPQRFMSTDGNVDWSVMADDEDGNDDDDVARKDFPDAFGSIVMPDAYFVITTRTVLIGRDVKAFKRYKGMHQYQLRVSEALEKGLPPPSPPKAVRRNPHGSYISEEGGILGPEDEAPNPAKRRKISASGEALAQRHARPDEHEHDERIISRREYLDHTPGAVPVDVGKLRPPENVIARLDIHGRGPDHFATTKGISREHLKIQYNPKKKLWEAHGLGRNGFFCEDNLYQKGQSVKLFSGAQLQIQNIQMTFRLTNVPDGKYRPEAAYSENGKSMSFDFVTSQHGQADTSDSEEGSVREGSRPATIADEFDDSDADMDDADAEEPTPDGDDYDGIRETVESDLVSERQKHEGSPDDADQLAQVPFAPKKRGPGRPPKNGVMSKRQERELRKQAQEAAKKNLPPQEPGDQPQKRKVGRPRKHPLPESAEGQAEKRKYKPRKPKGEDGEEELDGEKPTKERSQKHKTPPLELKREDFTEEQLQKPTKNYQLLIDEIMSAAPEKGYSLKQVYKRIQEKWPFFYFCVDTKGWESSVRHNLLGSECFQKIDGNWHRVAGVPLESGKKRKPSDSTADPRPTAMYNGYTHPYQHAPSGQSHGHQPVTHSSGLGQPNLPPRYPPNGQAYQIHPSPHASNGQANGPPNPQGPPRPGFPQHQAHTTTPANAYTPAGAPPRPQYPGPQTPAYNPAYGNRPQQPRPVVPGPAGPVAGTNLAQPNQMAKPGSVSQPQQGMPVSRTISTPNSTRPALPPQPQQPMQRTTTPAPLAPIITPLLKTFIREFRGELLKQLYAKGEGKRSEAIAMSAINHGLGLTNRSLVPDKEIYEKPILEIFSKHKMTFPQRLAKEMSKTSSAPVVAASSKFPPIGSRTPQPPVPPRAALPQPSPGQAAQVGNTAPHSAGQVDKSINVTGSVTNGNVQGQSAAGTPKPVSDTAAPALNKPESAGPVSSTPTAAVPANSTSVAANSTSTVPRPTVSTSTPAGSAPNQTANLGSAAPGPSAASVGIAPSPPADTSGATPKPGVNGPAPTASASTSDTVPKPAVPSPTGANAGTSGPTTTSDNPAQGTSVTQSAATPVARSKAQATSTTATPTPDLVRPVSTGPTTAASTSSRPASVAPSPGVSATTATPAARPATAGPAPLASPAVATVNNGPSRPSSSTATPAVKTPVLGPPRATPTRAGGSATPESARDIQLLEPKLVELILNFKSSILPTLAGKLNELLGESLIMSAVNRQLGFTDESFVETTTELQKKNFAEAENTLMLHLETRFNQYRRDRERDRASQR